VETDSAALPGALCQPDAYPHATASIRLVETHISWVLLTGEFAYKLKKPVQLPFVNFSTLARREHFCREEVRLNARLAPEIYLDVVPIGGSMEKPRVGAEPGFEYAVKMRQFDAAATADRLAAAGSFSTTELADLADRIAQFHQSLGTTKASSQVDGILQNLTELAEIADRAPNFATGLEPLLVDARAEVSRRSSVFADRLANDCVRECHGDLHLGNVARIGEHLVPFDCLEFDKALRTIDVIDEVAFLCMDLFALDSRDLAFAFLNRYLEITGDYAGLRLFRLCVAHRALVRLKVAAISADIGDRRSPGAAIDRYQHVAAAALAPAQGRLLITHGLSGSGKTTLARALAPKLAAIHVRSDIERKRLHGLAALDDAGSAPEQGLYRPEVSDATYAALLEAAEAALDGGLTVIVDASFLGHSRRQRFQSLARSRRAPFLVLHCKGAESTLRKRIARRRRSGDDPSDADESVLSHQQATAEPLSSEELADTLVINTESHPDLESMIARISTRNG